MSIDALRKENELLDIFCSLAEIPSPSLHEEEVIKWIQNFCSDNGINCQLDDYKNVYIYVPPTDESKEPIMFSSHMDVVGDASPIELNLDGNFIKANNRTLGADDKVGVASALYLAKEVVNDKSIKHGGLEITFTRDEETNMSGIEHVEFSKIKSKYILVCDADKLAQVQISGASYTNAKIFVKGHVGGHSGIDIGDRTRLNAAKLIAELLNNFPQGVYYEDETGVITSCNLGAIVAGGIQNAVKSLIDDQVNSPDYINTIIQKSSTNIINTDARASYSIRSASVEKEEELKNIMKKCVEDFNKKYDSLAKAEINFEVHLPPFEKAADDSIPELHTKVCNKLGIQNEVSSFHAGAETHIYAHQKNSKGETFMPFLLGLADVYNMHSANEKVDFTTLLKGYSIIKELFIEFNS
ncbi:MAG: M20/M25/M40 family metallo-hydrolase [Cyanobacteria bacterium RUI128]|nr:M20/M25/M40 family metallo-hydrolase [Cyanobacteria bacterium RUI128]